MVRIKTTGSFKHMEGFLKKAKEADFTNILKKYGEEGVKALSEATPKRTGKTAESWFYKIDHYSDSGSYTITWCNSNVNITPHGRANIAVILETGHATRSGAYVQGREYIKPAIQPIFDKIANEAWREVTK